MLKTNLSLLAFLFLVTFAQSATVIDTPVTVTESAPETVDAGAGVADSTGPANFDDLFSMLFGELGNGEKPDFSKLNFADLLKDFKLENEEYGQEDVDGVVEDFEI